METIVVVGPTASGKSDYAISLARETGGEIVSADSRQVYRGMDIGTGKVTRDRAAGHPEPAEGSSKYEEIDVPGKTDSSTRRLARNDISYISGGIRHHLLDVASPKRTYTVTHFLRDAKAAIDDIRKRGKTPIICGGTNFWIEALVSDTAFPAVRPDPTLRKTLGRLTAPELFTMLEEKDPDRARTIDRHNKVRLIRALEIVATLGKVPTSGTRTQESGMKRERTERFRFIGIDISREQLRKNIERRLDKRLGEGMVNEVRRLREEEGISWKRLEGFGLEYRWCALFLQGKITETELRDGITRDSLSYAKRQMTFLRKLERNGIRIEWRRI
ncbi:MAG: tRNA dimethylallyltransferase [Candidatus Moranbacteria bacterium]|nr:tRNA dimethylallyltransferase [Candidatus Moranbacteria bacterium]